MYWNLITIHQTYNQVTVCFDVCEVTFFSRETALLWRGGWEPWILCKNGMGTELVALGSIWPFSVGGKALTGKLGDRKYELCVCDSCVDDFKVRSKEDGNDWERVDSNLFVALFQDEDEIGWTCCEETKGGAALWSRRPGSACEGGKNVGANCGWPVDDFPANAPLPENFHVDA